MKLINDDCLNYLKTLTHNSIDSCVTDPPAGIEFMGKEWDSFKTNKRSKGWAQQGKDGGEGFGGFGKRLRPSFYSQTKNDRDNFIEFITETFIEVKRVLKPGAHCFVWALPRTSHWTATALEDAGFEIRDIVTHVFGSGFPKSLNIEKTTNKIWNKKLENVKNVEKNLQQKIIQGI